jgi:hypothetical protein
MCLFYVSPIHVSVTLSFVLGHLTPCLGRGNQVMNPSAAVSRLAWNAECCWSRGICSWQRQHYPCKQLVTYCFRLSERPNKEMPDAAVPCQRVVGVAAMLRTYCHEGLTSNPSVNTRFISTSRKITGFYYRLSTTDFFQIIFPFH